MDISHITQAARVVEDETGSPVVILPLSLWQELLSQLTVSPRQHERIKAILNQWKSEPETLPAEWWADFDADLRANRTTFNERDTGRSET